MTQAIAIDYPNETLPVRTQNLMECQRVVNRISPLTPEIFKTINHLMSQYDLDGLLKLEEQHKKAQ